MELNPEIISILKEFNIDHSEGLLCLLGIYYKLDVERTCSEETIKAINLTKIVDKDYENKIIKWHVPLFIGQVTEWQWVKEWNNKWNINMTRKDSNPDVLKRMQEFFSKYPEYRKEDVIKATDAYFSSLKSMDYLKSSAKFIFDGAGGMKKSILLSWCEKVKNSSEVSNQKGKVIT